MLEDFYLNHVSLVYIVYISIFNSWHVLWIYGLKLKWGVCS